MDENSLAGVLLSWVPMLLVIGVWIFFMRKHFSSGPQQQVIEAYKKHNELLRQVIERMDRRIARLEDTGKGREQSKQ
ncbi:MAG: hypothetical protein ABL907_04505 [Hyphomicrobium sp.]